MLHKQKRIFPARLFIALVLAIGIIWPLLPIQAQKTTQVYIEHADYARLGSENGRNFQRLVGNYAKSKYAHKSKLLIIKINRLQKAKQVSPKPAELRTPRPGGDKGLR